MTYVATEGVADGDAPGCRGGCASAAAVSKSKGYISVLTGDADGSPPLGWDSGAAVALLAEVWLLLLWWSIVTCEACELRRGVRAGFTALPHTSCEYGDGLLAIIATYNNNNNKTEKPRKRPSESRRPPTKANQKTNYRQLQKARCTSPISLLMYALLLETNKNNEKEVQKLLCTTAQINNNKTLNKRTVYPVCLLPRISL
jgi:hypothetical protein